jgi:hypothetical protein
MGTAARILQIKLESAGARAEDMKQYRTISIFGHYEGIQEDYGVALRKNAPMIASRLNRT